MGSTVPAAAGRRLDPGTFQSAEFQSIPGNAGLRGGASRLSTGGDAQASAAETSPGVYAAIRDEERSPTVRRLCEDATAT